MTTQLQEWGGIEAQPMDVCLEDGETVELKRTYCKVCMTNCGLVAEVAGDSKILKVKGDFDHPITKGYTCPKGRATGQNINNLTCNLDMDPLGGMAHYSAVPIEIEPAEAA